MNENCSRPTMALLSFDRIQTVPQNVIDTKHPNRTLKIEATGDFWKGRIKPQIRLAGQWLERAGFPPGARVSVTWLAPGVIELRVVTTVAAEELARIADPKSDNPF